MSTSPRSDTSTSSPLPYSEHLVPRGDFKISARHYAGIGPAFVLMHGFPDNLHIYDHLVPYLRDRQVITFDFLGWGTSEKPMDYPYTSKQQEGDLQTVLDTLGVEQVVLVAHDASGPVAINWALDHPERVSALVLLNTYYADAPTLCFPEFIALFADPAHTTWPGLWLKNECGPVAPQMAGGTVRRGSPSARNTAATRFTPVCRPTKHLPGFHLPDERPACDAAGEYATPTRLEGV